MAFKVTVEVVPTGMNGRKVKGSSVESASISYEAPENWVWGQRQAFMRKLADKGIQYMATNVLTWAHRLGDFDMYDEELGL